MEVDYFHEDVKILGEGERDGFGGRVLHLLDKTGSV
jgi:hypothetical protein